MGSISVPVIAAVGAEGTADGAAAVSAGSAALTASTAASLSAEGATDLALGTAGVASSVAAPLSIGSSIFTLANAATAAGLVGSGISAYGQHEAGVAQSNDAKMRARQAGLQAGQQQINIRQNMLNALASQNASAGASGIGTGGSFGANVKRQITQNQNDLLALGADASAEQQQYGAQASNAMLGGNIKAGASLIDSANVTGVGNLVTQL